MAVSKQKKIEQVADYKELVEKSQAIIVARYGGMKMSQLDKVRKQIRDAQGEFHVTKNTLIAKVLDEGGYAMPDEWLKGSTALVFAFKDPAAAAKAVGDLDKEFEHFKTVGGVMSGQAIDANGVKDLAALPPLPMLRAQLIGLLDAPASGIVGVLNAVLSGVPLALQARVDKDQPAAGSEN